MKITLESTDHVIQVAPKPGGNEVRGRVWQGETAAGVPCFAVVALIAADPLADQEEFERDLQEHAAPKPETVKAFPLRMVL